MALFAYNQSPVAALELKIPQLTQKFSLGLSLGLHGVLFLFALALGVQKTVDAPVGVELMYGEESTVSVPSASLAPAQKTISTPKPAPRDEGDVVVENKKTEVAVPSMPVAASVGNPMGNSEKGALTGREGVSNGQEMSPEDRYLYELRRLLERKKKYPVMAKKMRQTGRVLVRFVLSQDGSLIESEIVEKAAFDSLNQAATDLVQSISGARPFPHEIQKTTWNITVPIDYQLN